MDNNNEVKEIDMKNRTCYYFNDVLQNFDWSKIITY